MRFYSIKILTNTDGAETRDLRGFDTLDEALVRYHNDLQASISKCKSVYCAVINGVGGVYKSDVWSAEIAQPEA